jgi:NAD(P)H-quinone oxidoreductase subunit I
VSADVEPKRRSYLGNILKGAHTTAEGLAVTLAQYFRRPTTVQYPDRTAVPVVDSLPERYRGFLEVDMALCTGCKACERDCPIDVIAIDIEKVGGARVMTRFDIDMGKCMYCGICVDSCPQEAQAPGDREVTKCIRMTREFEGVTRDLSTLTFRFVEPGTHAVPFKPKKGVSESTPVRGEIARKVRATARRDNPPAFRAALASSWQRGDAAEVAAESRVEKRAAELLLLVEATAGEQKKLEDLMFDQALPQTDCEECGYFTCREYARMLLSGGDTGVHKCVPGGPTATRDLNLILQLRLQRPAKEAAQETAALVLHHHT